MTCGGINMEEMSIQSMCACAASVREMSTTETTPSLIRISSTPGSPFNRERALSIWGCVTTPTSSRTLSTYCSLCCTGWGRKLDTSLSQNRGFSSEGAFRRRNRNVVAAATAPESFHGYTLCEIARLIDVPTQFDGQMIGEKLKWDHRENGHDVIGRFRE